jgi:Tfp pilus assembly protein PilF
VFVLNKIAKAYLKMDNKEGALIYINKALMLDRENVEALSMFAQIKSINQ